MNHCIQVECVIPAGTRLQICCAALQPFRSMDSIATLPITESQFVVGQTLPLPRIVAAETGSRKAQAHLSAWAYSLSHNFERRSEHIPATVSLRYDRPRSRIRPRLASTLNARCPRNQWLPLTYASLVIHATDISLQVSAIPCRVAPQLRGSPQCLHLVALGVPCFSPFPYAAILANCPNSFASFSGGPFFSSAVARRIASSAFRFMPAFA